MDGHKKFVKFTNYKMLTSKCLHFTKHQLIPREQFLEAFGIEFTCPSSPHNAHEHLRVKLELR